MIQSPRLPPDPTLSHLGAGEREALLLMHDHQGTVLVTDDREAYRTARAQAIPVVRTLRLLEIGAERGLLDFPTTIARLRAAGFYLPEEIVDEMVARDAARKAAASRHPPERLGRLPRTASAREPQRQCCPRRTRGVCPPVVGHPGYGVSNGRSQGWKYNCISVSAVS